MEEELHVWNVTEQLLASRVIKIYGQINTEVAHEVTALLDVLNFDDDETPIKLEICTPGGSVLDGLAICDKIREIHAPVIAFNTGYCASMGTAICSVCDAAFGGENCCFMIHEMSSGTEGKFRDMKAQLDFDEKLNKRLMTLIAKKCHKTYEEVMSDAVRDLWMSADEAKAYGLIDNIMPAANKDEKVIKDFVKDIVSKGKRK